MKKWPFVALLLVGSALLGATVLREPVAWAKQIVEAQIVAPLDANGNVKVHEQGTVQVAGTVGVNPASNNVTVDNSAANPVPVSVEQQPLEPVQVSERVSLLEGEFDKQEPLYTVPPGKLLIVEFVSAVGAHTQDTSLVRAEVSVGSGFFTPRVNLPLIEAREAGPFAAAEDVTLYAEAGETVYGRYLHNPGGSAGSTLNCDFTVVGRLVDAT
jgi:hypothetical protein